MSKPLSIASSATNGTAHTTFLIIIIVILTTTLLNISYESGRQQELVLPPNLVQKIIPQDAAGDTVAAGAASTSRPFNAYLLINRHSGVEDDIRFVANRLNFKFDKFDSSNYFDKNETFKKDVHHADFMSEQEADTATVRAVADDICRKYDVVIVADINSDARFLLQRIDHSPETCGIKKVVILSTQRFDFHLNHIPQDSESKMRIYHNMIKRVTNRSVNQKVGPEIIWVANSPFEIKYSEEKLGEQLPVSIMRLIIESHCLMPPPTPFL